MPNLQFPCPSCTQTVECEEQYAGVELTCPICQAAIVAPAAAEPAASPVTAGAPKKNRLSVSASAAHTAHAAAPQTQSHQVYVPPPKKPINKGPIIKIALAVILIPVGLYFAWPYIQKAQDKFSSKVDEAGAGSGGGQLGHLAELNSVLDATEPAKMSSFPPGGGTYDSAIDQAQQAASPQQKPSINLPSIPPTYTLSADETEIPNSKLNGTLAGHEFVPDLVRFDKSGQNYVLTLREGTNGIPDRELFIYLRTKGAKSFETNSLLIAKEFKAGNPQIIKKWKTGPMLFGQKTFSAGYVMRLELDKIANGSLSGKIYVALPDPEKTVVAGHFTAATTIDTPTQ